MTKAIVGAANMFMKNCGLVQEQSHSYPPWSKYTLLCWVSASVLKDIQIYTLLQQRSSNSCIFSPVLCQFLQVTLIFNYLCSDTWIDADSFVVLCKSLANHGYCTHAVSRYSVPKCLPTNLCQLDFKPYLLHLSATASPVAREILLMMRNSGCLLLIAGKIFS